MISAYFSLWYLFLFLQIKNITDVLNEQKCREFLISNYLSDDICRYGLFYIVKNIENGYSEQSW